MNNNKNNNDGTIVNTLRRYCCNNNDGTVKRDTMNLDCYTNND